MSNKELEEFIHSTKKLVLSVIRQTLYEKFYSSVDDVMQETYLRAYRALKADKFRADSSVSTWLYVIAKNESLRMNGKLLKEEEKREKLKKSKLDKRPDSEESSDRDFSSLLKSIKSLPAKYFEVINARLSGQSVAEIALEYNLKEGTVKSRLARARDFLKRIVKGGKENE